jgi:hypothetical protein
MSPGRQAVPDEQVRLSTVEINLVVGFDQLDGEVIVRSGEVGESRREKPRRPLPGRDADDTGGLVAEGHAPAVDGGGGFRHALGHREQVLTPAGQPMPVRSALEETRAECLFELAQAADDGGLPEAQRSARPP